MSRLFALMILMLPGAALAYIPDADQTPVVTALSVTDVRAMPEIPKSVPESLLACILPAVTPDMTLPTQSTATVSLGLARCAISG